MLNLYRYMIENRMKELEDIPETYQKLLKEELEPAPVE